MIKDKERQLQIEAFLGVNCLIKWPSSTEKRASLLSFPPSFLFDTLPSFQQKEATAVETRLSLPSQLLL